jgi:hypothetical protein
MVENQYDGYLRRTQNQIRLTGGAALAAVAFGYSHASGWLDNLTSGKYAVIHSRTWPPFVAVIRAIRC